MRPYRGDEFFFVKIGGGDFIEGVDLKWEDNDVQFWLTSVILDLEIEFEYDL